MVNLKKDTILLIDDDFHCCRSLKNVVKSSLKKLSAEDQYEVISGRDGLDTLNYIIEDQKNDSRIKLIISDENMVFINGSDSFRVIHSLIASRKLSKVTMIILTALEEKDALNYIKSVSQAKEVLRKPANVTKVQEIISKYVVNCSRE